jgi:hypothetical protein
MSHPEPVLLCREYDSGYGDSYANDYGGMFPHVMHWDIQVEPFKVAMQNISWDNIPLK